MKKKVLFIINPVSGGKKKDGVPGMIAKYLDHHLFDDTTVYSETEKGVSALARQRATDHDMIVAVGGDGTVNEIASQIAGTDKVLAILPFGSGNGLARFLQVPLDIKGAIKNINTGVPKLIDGARLNGRWFFNMAGMGFDAHISEVFSHDRTRGFQAYIRSSLTEIANYKPQQYQIEIDGSTYEREAFMLSFANSSQYGNNAHISPHASLHDGLIDVCIIKPFPKYRLVEMGFRMLTKTSEGTKYVEIIRGKNVKVKRVKPGPVHLDGEPRIMEADAEIKVVPDALWVITGSSYKG